jgi:hypothetical protein
MLVGENAMTPNPNRPWPEEDDELVELRLYDPEEATNIIDFQKGRSIDEIIARGRSPKKVCSCNNGVTDNCVTCATGEHNICVHRLCPLGRAP